MQMYLPKGPAKGGSSFAVPGFDRAAWMQSEAGQNIGRMKAIAKQYPDEEMATGVVQYWEAHGVRKELFDAEENDGLGKYSVFTPLDLDYSKKYALVYCNHAGMTPINQYETCGFPMLAGKEKFICVCPWNGGPSNDLVQSEFPRILDSMREWGYPIDWERVYVTGFSAGSDATGVLACAYPETIAAISPDPGANMFLKGKWYESPEQYSRAQNYQMPVICVGGTMDGGDAYPLSTEEGIANFNIWMERIVKIQNYPAASLSQTRCFANESSDLTKRYLGFEFHNTYSLSLEGLNWHVGEYLSKGAVYARFIVGEGVPHTQTKYHAALVWDFLKHFSRDLETGASVYSPIVLDGIRDRM